ncbi:hypothetical protein Tco_0835856 [Tanacetum coccineum]
MPRGTTQVVTRGASNDWCQMCRWRLDQSDGDTWHWRVSVRGTVAVSTRMDLSPNYLIHDIKEEAEEPEKKRAKEALEKGPKYEFLSYAVSDSDSDLESTARSGPKCNELEDTCESRTQYPRLSKPPHPKFKI